MGNRPIETQLYGAPGRIPRGGSLARACALTALCVLALLAGPGQAAAAPGDITTAAGNGVYGYAGDGGPATSAAMRAPIGVGFSGGDLLIADFSSHVVRRVDAGGTISTFAGTGTSGSSGDGGPATSARLDQPGDVVSDAAGNVYISDFANSRVRRVLPDGTITNFAGTGQAGYQGDGGPALTARLAGPVGLEIDAAGNVYVSDFGNHTVRRITPAGIITTVAGTGNPGSTGDGGPATSARLNEPADVSVDASGNVFISEYGGHRVRKVDSGGTISTIAGTGTAGYSGDGGPAAAARLSLPVGVEVDSAGEVFIADTGNHAIRKINAGGNITRVAGTTSPGFSGDGGPAISAQLNFPTRVSLTPSGDFYISDWGNSRVRRVEALGAPAAPSLTGTAPASPSPSNNPRVQGSALVGSTVRLYTNSTCSSAVAATGTAAELAGAGIAVTVADNSATTFWATATDAWGNASGCSTTSVTYVEDSSPPSAPAIDSAPPSPGNDATPSWSFSAAGSPSFECRLARGATVVSGWTACTSAHTYDLSSQPDGTYTFSVRARDVAGNAGASASSSYQFDTTGPATTIDSPPASPGNGRSPAWAFSAEAGATFECRLERGATVLSDWGSCTSPQVYDLTGEPDGISTFSVRARDGAGNTGSATTSTYELDTVAPIASIDSAPLSPGNDGTPTWSFSAEPGASLECRIERGATVVSDWAACSSPRT